MDKAKYKYEKERPTLCTKINLGYVQDLSAITSLWKKNTTRMHNIIDDTDS